MVTHEHYRDSEAAIEHMKSIDMEVLDRVLEITTLEALEVYGDPNPELMAMFGRGGKRAVVYPLFATLAAARQSSAFSHAESPPDAPSSSP